MVRTPILTKPRNKALNDLLLSKKSSSGKHKSKRDKYESRRIQDEIKSVKTSED